MPVLPDNERHDWIRLARTQNVGSVTFAQLLKRFGGPATALDALPEIARRAGPGRPIVTPSVEDIDAGVGEAGFVTVSGVALGIDGEARAASLRPSTNASTPRSPPKA